MGAQSLSLLLTQFASKYNYVFGKRLQSLCKIFSMSGPFNQQQRRAAFIQAGKQIVKNKSVALFVVYKLLIDVLNTGSLFP
ncbi:hypothetical protein D3C71_1946780 [compost metagenome]